MIQTQISTGDYDIVASGIFHAPTDKESTITLANLKFIIVFTDTEEAEPNLSTEKVDSITMRFNFINFRDALGRGNSMPIHIGRLNDKPLFLAYRVFALNDTRLRTFEYTFYCQK